MAFSYDISVITSNPCRTQVVRRNKDRIVYVINNSKNIKTRFYPEA